MLTKKSTLAAAVVLTTGLLAVTNASAGVDGPYIGGDIGYGFLHQEKVSGLTTSSSSSTGIAGRADLGFQFSTYFALEAGYTKYSNANIKGYNDFLFNGNAVFDSYAIDVLVRATMPMGGGFTIFGKIGPAYLKEISTVTAQYTDAALIANPAYIGTSFRGITTDSKVFPEVGIGAMYDFSTNFVGDITWMHIQRIGDNTLRNADFAGVGLTYNLG
jgi:Outer membrane protein beta-barrel domain